MILTIGHILGYIAVALNLVMFISKNRKVLLVFKLIVEAFWTASYLCLGATTGGILCGISIFRTIIYSLREKYKWANNTNIPIIFVGIVWVTFILTYQGWYSLFASIGSTFSAVAFYMLNTKKIKKMMLHERTSYLIYSIAVQSNAAVLSCFVGYISLILGLINEYRKPKVATKNK